VAPFDTFVGVGLGIDVHNSQPDWRGILANTEALGVDFLEVYTRGDVDWAHTVKTAARDFPLLYHDDAMDPILPGGVREDLVALAAENLSAVGAPWCVSELATRRLGDRYLDFFMPIVLSDEAADVAAENLRALDERLPGRIVFENPPFQLPVGPLHILELMARVAERSSASCVLDLGHLYSFQICRGLEPLAGLDEFPLEVVVELHVAGATVEDRHGAPVYQDMHGGAEIPPVLLEMLGEVAPRCPNLRAITIEVEDADDARTRRQIAQTRESVQSMLDAR
jgi:uncharacterized protein (UPF0276 family)